MSQVVNPAVTPASRRRSQRVLMQVGIRLRGKDAQDKPFEESTQTLAINAHGALVGMKSRVTTGNILKMQHNMTEEEQECKVVFLGPVREGKTEVGLEFSTPRPAFWRVAFPPEDWTPKHPEARAATTPGVRPVEKPVKS
jgi:hypothetical protein